MMKNVFLFGECMIELMAASNEAASGKLMKQAFAGDVFNTAVYLKRLFADAQVNLFTAVGTDSFSNDMVNYFESEQLGTDFVFRSADKIPGLYAIELDQFGERSFTYWRENSAARNVMDFVDQSVVDKFSTGDVFFFSGISLGVVKPEQREQFWQFIAQLKAIGVQIVFDLNYRPKLWTSKEEAQIQFKLAFENSDVLLPGVDDFAAIFDIDTIDGVVAYFGQYQYQELVVKNGEKNVYCLSSQGQQVVDVTPVTNVVDTTSAGDSFNGGYLGARLDGQPITQAVELANQVAGFVIQHRGAIVDKSLFSARFK